MRKLVPHFVSCWHGYYIATIKLLYKDYYIYIYKSGDQLVNKWTDNDTDHFVAAFLNPT